MNKILLMETTYIPYAITNMLKGVLSNVEINKCELYLFTSVECYPYLTEEIKAYFIGIEIFDNYYNSPLVEYTAYQLHKRFRYNKVISLREFDLVRAARIRENLGISGMRVKEAISFRDKFVMKQKAKASGLLVPEFTNIDTPYDLIQFANTTGYPLIVKPRRQAMGVGFHIIRDLNDITELFKKLANTATTDTSLDLIAEKFIGGIMAHVDGVIHQGNIVAMTASEYIGLKPHHAIQINIDYTKHYSGSLVLERSSYKAKNLCAYTKKLLTAFDAENSYGFHVELWIDEAGEQIMLNEAAARMGGGQVYALQEAIYGKNPEVNLFTYLSYEDEAELINLNNNQPTHYAFSGRIPATVSGKLVSFPSHLKNSGVYRYNPRITVGDNIKAATGWHDNWGHIITIGNTTDACLINFENALKEFNAQLIVE